MSDEREPVYHVQLRQFPHNHCRFNLCEEDVAAIAGRWARDEWVQEGDRKWSPHQAQLTILAGPRLAVAQLAIGRGWRNAGRDGVDVTDRVLAASRGEAAWSAERDARGGPGARRALEGAPLTPAHVEAQRESARPAQAQSPDLALLADSVGLELLALLDLERTPLAHAYALARARLPERRASECLALAELAVRSLLARRLVEVVREAEGGESVLGGRALEDSMGTLESWVDDGAAAGGVWLRRSEGAGAP